MKKATILRLMSLFICISILLFGVSPIYAYANTEEVTEKNVAAEVPATEQGSVDVAAEAPVPEQGSRDIAAELATLQQRSDDVYVVLTELTPEQEALLETWRAEFPEAYLVSYKCLAVGPNTGSNSTVDMLAIAVPMPDEAPTTRGGASYTIMFSLTGAQAQTKVDYTTRYDDKGYALNTTWWGEIRTDKGNDYKTHTSSGSGTFYTLWRDYNNVFSCKGSCGNI